MIYDVSRRTDVPAFFWDWFANRLDAGTVSVRNPYYHEKVSTYDLSPDVCDGFHFYSKNYAPALNHPIWPMRRVVETYPTIFSCTVNAYGPDLEAHVPPLSEQLEAVWRLADIAGPKRLTWLYSPVVLTDTYDAAFHFRAFNCICDRLADSVDAVHIDFLNHYDKLKNRASHLLVIDDDTKRIMLYGFAEIAAKYSLPVQVCINHTHPEHPNLTADLCLTLDKFGTANDIPMKTLTFKNSGIFGCNCTATRDVAAYNTCPHGCVYCYANQDHLTTAPYDSTSPMLVDAPRPDDIVSFAKQTTYRKPDTSAKLKEALDKVEKTYPKTFKLLADS